MRPVTRLPCDHDNVRFTDWPSTYTAELPAGTDGLFESLDGASGVLGVDGVDGVDGVG